MQVVKEESLLDADEVSDERKAALIGQILRGELTPQEACESEGLSEAELKRWVHSYTRAARRAIDNQVSAALAAHGLELEDPPAPALSGNLGSVGLGELIQTIQLGRKDAHIRIDHDGQQSELWCEQGDVIDAASGQLMGSAAVYRILTLERGQLHADFVPVDRPRTIHASTHALMLEAAKRADECAAIRGRLGDTLNLYVPSSSAPSPLELDPDQAAVLRAFDGERSIEDVVQQSELPDLEALACVERLIDQEWLVLQPFRAIRRSSRAAPKSTPPAVAEASFRPLATSLTSRLPWQDGRQRLWASAFAGAAVVVGAFAFGFFSARRDEPAAKAPAANGLVSVCRANQALLPGGVCIDRAAVSAGDYQACVRAGACEPAQRELEPPALAVGASAQPEPAAPAPASGAAAPAATGASAAAEPVPRAASAGRDEATSRCNAGLPGREPLPLNCVTFQQARGYCEWRGGRLPLQGEWEHAASAKLGVSALASGLSEWAIEPAGAGGTRERSVVLGAGLENGSGAAGGFRRLAMNANAQGRNVGFRCVVRAETVPASAVAANREPASP